MGANDHCRVFFMARPLYLFRFQLPVLAAHPSCIMQGVENYIIRLHHASGNKNVADRRQSLRTRTDPTSSSMWRRFIWRSLEADGLVDRFPSPKTTGVKSPSVVNSATRSPRIH